ncbi:hypothetical protein L1887_19139 [Cichorium endivia]|nr:hypothetical protein L1887_19139 [Cichorium endivia]
MANMFQEGTGGRDEARKQLETPHKEIKESTTVREEKQLSVLLKKGGHASHFRSKAALPIKGERLEPPKKGYLRYNNTCYESGFEISSGGVKPPQHVDSFAAKEIALPHTTVAGSLEVVAGHGVPLDSQIRIGIRTTDNRRKCCRGTEYGIVFGSELGFREVGAYSMGIETEIAGYIFFDFMGTYATELWSCRKLLN